jgi:hypothetical protein
VQRVSSANFWLDKIKGTSDADILDLDKRKRFSAKHARHGRILAYTTTNRSFFLSSTVIVSMVCQIHG